MAHKRPDDDPVGTTATEVQKLIEGLDAEDQIEVLERVVSAALWCNFCPDCRAEILLDFVEYARGFCRALDEESAKDIALESSVDDSAPQ